MLRTFGSSAGIFRGALEMMEVKGPVRQVQNISEEASLTVKAEGRSSFAVRIAAK